MNSKQARVLDLGSGSSSTALLDQRVSAGQISALSAEQTSRRGTAHLAEIKANEVTTLMTPTQYKQGNVVIGAIYLFAAAISAMATKGFRFLVNLDTPNEAEANSPAAKNVLANAVRTMAEHRNRTNVLTFAPTVGAFSYLGYWDAAKQAVARLIRIDMPSAIFSEIGADGKTVLTNAWAALAHDGAGTMLGAVYVQGRELFIDSKQNLESALNFALKTGLSSFTRFNPLYTESVRNSAKKQAKVEGKKGQHRDHSAGSRNVIQPARVAISLDNPIRSSSKPYVSKKGQVRILLTDTKGLTWKYNITACFQGGEAVLIESFRAAKGAGDPIGPVDAGTKASQRMFCYNRYAEGGIVEQRMVLTGQQNASTPNAPTNPLRRD